MIKQTNKQKRPATLNKRTNKKKQTKKILTGLVSLLFKGLSGVFSSTTVQRHQFFGTPPSLQSSSHTGM